MPAPSFWEGLRRARIVQVLLVYLGASWGVLQFVDTLTEALTLPEWVAPVAIILLLIGLVIILATAWVQSLPSTTAAEEAGELPTDWEIAPADVVDSIRQGKLPHLTWGRAILGGVFAISMLFGVSGLYVLVTGGRSFVGPQAIAASDAAEGIAILPFSVSGVDDEAFWGEGMVDLLSTNLDGMGGYRTIDARTVMARWRESIGDAEAPDLESMLLAAGRTGARFAILGSAVGIGDDLRLVTEIYDLSNGQEVGDGQVAGSKNDPMSLIDDLSLEAMRALLSGAGDELATTRNLADLTTASLPALRAYLEGERHYRRAEFPQAVDAYERALEADSTFALALFRLSDTYGWLEDVSSETAIDLAERSTRFKDRLSVRNAVIVTAGAALYANDLTVLEDLEAAVRKYPDDPEAWFMLAESYIHLGEATRATDEDALEAVERAIQLDPSFGPYYVHAIDLCMTLDRPDDAEAYEERYIELIGHEAWNEEYVIAFDLLFGDDAERAAAWRSLDGLTDQRAGVLWGTFGFRSDRVPVLREIAEYMRRRSGQDGWWYALARWSAMDGRWDHGTAMLSDSLPAGPDVLTVYLFNNLIGPQPDELLDVVRSCELGPGCTLQAGALAAEEGDWDRHRAAIEHAAAAAERYEADGDAITARVAMEIADVLTGYGQLVRGQAALARTTLEAAQGQSVGTADIYARLWLAEANEALDRHQDALRWYGLLLGTYYRSHAHYKRARIAEQMGDLELARSEWEKLLVNLGNAEPVDPRPAEARAALARLGA